MKCRHRQIDHFVCDGSWRCRDCRQDFEPSTGWAGLCRTLYVLAIIATALALLSLVIPPV